MSLLTTPSGEPNTKQDHILIFPFFSKGHSIPLLHLASTLSSRDILVTLITTPANSPFFRRHLPSSHNLRLLPLPFPSHPSLPSGIESTDSLPSISLFPAFLAATASLEPSFIVLLRSLLRSPCPPLCLVSDFFLGWTLPVCRRFGLPRLVFHGMSAFSMSLCKSLWLNIPKNDPFSVPGAPPGLRLNKTDVPVSVLNSLDPGNAETQFLNLISETDVGSWGVIVNSFAELESPVYVQLLESFYKPVAGGRLWFLGPLNLLAPINNNPITGLDCVRWLDKQPRGSVLYVAFGTQAEVSDEQLDEVAYGLVSAGVLFLWAVRSGTWVAPENLSELGRIERGWVPQNEILSHVAVGGFVSHCGWNSVLEAVTAGVAVIGLPMIAEQGLNAKMVEEEIGVGIRIEKAEGEMLVRRREVEKAVRELMGGEKGRRIREKVCELKKKAMEAVVKGGSSYLMLEKLLDELRRVRKVKEIEDGGFVENEGVNMVQLVA